MTDPGGWAAPDRAGPALPATEVGYPTVVTGPVDQPNWGLAVPGHALPGLAMLVPRPPRPGVVSAGLRLAYAGVVVSGLETLAGAVYSLTNRDRLAARMMTGESAPDTIRFMSTFVTVGTVVNAIVWLLAAAGTVTCIIIAARGRNPARIVLICLMGLFALQHLCGFAGDLVASGLTGSADQSSPFSLASAQAVWWQVALRGLLGVLAATVLVLLLLGPANRYYSPGPGRRFAPPADQPADQPGDHRLTAGEGQGGSGHTGSGR